MKKIKLFGGTTYEKGNFDCAVLPAIIVRRDKDDEGIISVMFCWLFWFLEISKKIK